MGTKPAPALDPGHHEGPGTGQTAPPLPTPTPGAHWSKDFVEHLRTVHFTLIAVAVGLIFLSFPRYDASKAQDELASIIGLKKSWSLDWLKEPPAKKPPAKDAFEDQDVRSFSQIDKGQQPISVLSDQPPLGVRVTWNGGQTRSFRFPANNWVISDKQNNVLPTGPLNEDLLAPFPDTVGGFEAWWDALFPGGIYINYPNAISNLATVWDKDHKSQNLAVAIIDETEPSFGKLVIAPGKVLKQTPGSLYYSLYDAQKNTFKFPMTTTSFHLQQIDISNKHNSDWKQGKFQVTFPELAKASAGSEQLSLEDLDARLKQEAAKGPETLDIFGLKIPANQSAAFLLVIQLYFVVTLKELNRKLSPQDGCWDVPWVGMYQDRLSRFLYVAMTGILPVVVIVLLFRQTLCSLVGSLHAASPATANIVGVCVALIASIILGWLSWKYRPQVGSA